MATYSELLDKMCACKTKTEADVLITAETDEVLRLRPELVREQARDIVMHNVGYMSGYCDRKQAAELLTLFGARHPVFGAIDEWPARREDTVELGMKIGRQKGGV